MCFPKDTHGQTLWVGFPLRRGVAIEFAATHVGSGINNFRMVDAVLKVDGRLIPIKDKTLINVTDLDGYNALDPWARSNLQRQARVILSRITRFRLTKQGNGFKLEAYFSDWEPADLIWTYVPEQGQPLADDFLGQRCWVTPTPIYLIPEYQVVTQVLVTEQVAT